MRIYIVVQARMASTRLPGKVLKEVMGKPLLAYQLERLQVTKRPIVVATTSDASDDPIISLCNKMGIRTFRGDEHDVLGRYYDAAEAARADTIVRVTADCPLIDPMVIERVIRYYLEHDKAYVSNTLERTYPRGMDVEVFSMDLLHQAHHNATLPYEREHVTPYIHAHFPTTQVKTSVNHSHYRLKVDEAADFVLIEKILAELYPKNPEFRLKEIVSLLEARPDLVEINQHIEQKENADRSPSMVYEPSLL